ncbi:hypothetical protein P3596_03680 [Vibrio parahaemolyticus]|nr:hypothetical protein [Vibrio parahaemolyticus]
MKRITKKVMSAVEGVKPSSELVRINDTELKHIKTILFNHKLHVSVEDQKFAYISKNHYELILESIVDSCEFKRLVINDFDVRFEDEIKLWISENELQYNIPLKESKLSKCSHILSKIDGATKRKVISNEGDKRRVKCIDSRLEKYLIKTFSKDKEFIKRFI